MNEQMKKPWLITRNIVVLPGTEKTIFVGRDLSVQAINLAIASDAKEIILVPQHNPKIESPKFGDLPSVGVLCEIVDHETRSENEHIIRVRGLNRVFIKKDKDDVVVNTTTVEFEKLLLRDEIFAWDFPSDERWITLLNLQENHDLARGNEQLRIVINEMNKLVEANDDLFTNFEEKYDDVFVNENPEFEATRQFVRDF